MRALVVVTSIAVIAFGGCGGEEATEQPQRQAPEAKEQPADEPPAEQQPAAEQPTAPPEADVEAFGRRPAGEDGLRVPARRARIVARTSKFGTVLFDSNGQVVYAFELDGKNRSACNDAECVKAWPPVLTREAPTAGAGADAAKLGTLRRRDGTTQVTYAGRPLYFYEHEKPGQILCHDVELNGGLWWVVTPSGAPAK